MLPELYLREAVKKLPFICNLLIGFFLLLFYGLKIDTIDNTLHELEGLTPNMPSRI